MKSLYTDNIAKKRTYEISVLSLIAIVGNLINSFFLREDLTDTIMLSVSAVIILFVILLSKKGKDSIASEILILTLTTLILTVIWSSGGLLDLSIIAIPGILVFSALLGAKRIYWFVFALFSISIIIIGVAEQFNLINLTTSTFGIARSIGIEFIIAVSAIAMWQLAKDYSNVIKRLKREVDKVEDSKTQMLYLAQHDHLTKLPNRVLAHDHFNHAKKMCQRYYSEKHIALINIDLDSFKNINDSLGYEIGDRYLIIVAKRLEDAVRISDTVCRLGGDEFLIIAEGITEDKDIYMIGKTILEKLSAPIEIDGYSLSCSGSIGVATYPSDGDDYDDLVKKSDIAMYRSKELGRNTIQYYDESMNISVLESIDLVEDMKKAIDKEEFILYYQPVVEIMTGKIIGAEALVRWIHPTKGFLPPDSFISIAEKSGLIVELGEWVLKQASIDTMAIQSSIMADFFIAVNVSPIQIKRDDFIPRVENIISKYPLKSGTLELELTESGLVSDSGVFTKALDFFSSNNISISIDDFGTGYSNLSYIQRINASKLKIDRCFVTDIGDNSNNRAIVSAISSMSNGLTLKTVAEGVEKIEELNVLLKMDIEYGQGYYWSRPVPINDFRSLLLEQKKDNL